MVIVIVSAITAITFLSFILCKSAKIADNRMEEILNKWRNMQITNAEVMEQLLLLAGEIKKDILAGNELGLTEEEKAFYDALTKPQAIKDFYTNFLFRPC